MVTLDLSSWVSDWCSHFVSSSIAGALAFWLTAITWLVLFKRAGFQHQSYAISQLIVVGCSILTTSLSAALLSSLLVHLLQDYVWGPFIHIDLVIRIL